MNKFCVPAGVDTFTHYDEVAEILTNYSRASTEAKHLAQKYENKKIVINLPSDLKFEQQDLNLLSNLSKKYANLKVRVQFTKPEIWQKLQDKDIPFFFIDPISDWEVLRGIAEKIHPTDIYITSPIAFSLDTVYSYLSEKHIKIRVVPNSSQAHWSDFHTLQSFFIRPQGLKHYNKYIDIYELFIGTINNLNTVYEIYQTEFWNDKLKYLIPNLTAEAINRSITPIFDKMRINCGHRCYTTGSCHICDHAGSLSEKIEQRVPKINNKNSELLKKIYADGEKLETLKNELLNDIAKSERET